jgi:hypothetical protein
VGWKLGLASWIIQDGTYGDLARGDRLECAVEFAFRDAPTIVDVQNPSARHVAGCDYDLVGKLIAVEQDAWAIDIGMISVFRKDTPPPGFACGDMVGGRACLGVDPFFYLERLGKRSSIPALIYAWQVNAIVREMAPFIPAGPRMLVRDPTKLRWVDVDRTNAATDDDGHGEYLLECELLGERARRTRSIGA